MPPTPVLTPAPALALPDTLPLGESLRVHVSFGLADARGRVIGCEVWIRHEPARLVRETPWGADPHPARYAFRPHATRDGAEFGAIPVRAWRTSGTYAEARAHAEAYVVGARERAWRTVVRLAAERADREDGHVRASQA
jgi:hypothetical protein